MNAPTLPNSDNEIDYILLQQIAKQNDTSQRALARSLGISVGKINYCLKAIIGKGWVKANNFRRADNKLAYAYVLTPSGMAEKVRLTHAFIQRKEKEFERLQLVIAELKHELDTPPGISEKDKQK